MVTMNEDVSQPQPFGDDQLANVDLQKTQQRFLNERRRTTSSYERSGFREASEVAAGVTRQRTPPT